MKKLLLIIALLISEVRLNAQSVGDQTTIDYECYSLEFTVTSVSPAECEVRCSNNPTTETELTIPSTVSINDESFSVTSVADSAFLGCNKFVGDLVLPNTIKSVGIRAFRDCEGFEGSLTLSENLEIIEDLAFAGGGDIMVNYTGELIIPNKVKHIGLTAFQNCSSLTSLTFEDNSQLTEIGKNAFRNCSSLTGDLIIPNSVASIGEVAFGNCSNLTSVEIPGGVTYIGDFAFGGCSSLTSVICYAENVPYTPNAIFSDVPSDMVIYLPANSVDTYWNWGYIIRPINTTIHYEDNYLKFTMTNSAECELSYCSPSATEVIIPSTVTMSGKEYSVTSIKEAVFYDHDELISVHIPDAIKYLPSSYYSYVVDDMFDWIEASDNKGMFEACNKLTSVTFGEDSKLIEIGVDAFAKCPKLINIDIPKTVKSIGGGAFYGCSSLESITIPQGVTCLGRAFETVFAVDDATGPYEGRIYTAFFEGCSGLESVTFEDNIQLTSIEENTFRGCSSLTDIEIPNSVTEIEMDPFLGCSSLTSVTFGENSQLTSIGGRIFKDCSSLKSIEIPNSVTSIATSAFSGCSNLESITVEEGNTVYDSRNNCNAIIESSTNKLRIGFKSTVIPNSVTSIGASAFANCSGLKSIGIPNSIIDIAASAFSGCSGLESIYCYAKYVPKTDESAFDGCPSNMIIYVLEESYGWYLTASPWNNYILRPLKDVPLNVVATAIDESTIKIEWNIVSSAASYNVYRRYSSRNDDFELIANIKETSFTDTGLDENTKYFYAVTSVDSEGNESDKSESVGATTSNPENVEELAASLNIYPNPVNDKLYIETEMEVLEVVVYDVYGRQQSTVNGQQSLSIDVNELNGGVYFVKVVTSEGEIVKRFIKK